MTNFEFGKNRDEKIDKALDSLGYYFHGIPVTSSSAEAIKRLTKELEKTQKSSENLTKALNRITFWGVVVAGSGVAVGFLSLLFEFLKYFHFI